MFRAQFELNSPNYIRYFGTTWKILFQYGKEYNIWAQSSTDHLTNFNIFAFLVFLRDSMNAFTANEYLIGVQSGFRYITG